MEHKLFNDTAELLKNKGIAMTASEVEDFCLGGEALDKVLSSDLANEICEYMGL